MSSRMRAERKMEAIPNQGPTTEKARLCLMEVRERGTQRRPCSAEQREWETQAQGVGLQSSTR